jgi:toxin FitB
LNVVDSSGWLEFFSAGPNGSVFRKLILAPKSLIVPSITIYEVAKKLLTEFDEETAQAKATHMRLGVVIDLDAVLAIDAAHYSRNLKLPMADAIIYATAKRHNATVWTMDEHFQGLPRVEYIPKK